MAPIFQGHARRETFFERRSGRRRGHGAAVRDEYDEIFRTGPPKAPLEAADKMVVDDADGLRHFLGEGLFYDC